MPEPTQFITTPGYDVNRVQHPDLSVLHLLLGMSERHKKTYVFPSQQTLLRALARRGRPMSRRTLNRHLGALEDQGWIRRTKRHRAGPRGFEMHSTLYQLCRRAIAWLKGFGSRLGAWAARIPSLSLRKSRVPGPAQYIPHRDIQVPLPPKNQGGEAATNPSSEAADAAIAEMRRILSGKY